MGVERAVPISSAISFCSEISSIMSWTSSTSLERNTGEDHAVRAKWKSLNTRGVLLLHILQLCHHVERRCYSTRACFKVQSMHWTSMSDHASKDIYNIHVPVHKRNATCRDTARVSKLDVLTHKSHWLCSTSWKHHVTLWLNVYEKDATWTAALCWRHGDYTIVWCLTTQTHTSKSCQLTSVGVQLSVLWLRSSCSWAPLCWSGHSREPPAGTQWWTGCHLFAEVASPVASFFLKHSKQLGDEKGRSWTSTLYECRLTPISSS